MKDEYNIHSVVQRSVLEPIRQVNMALAFISRPSVGKGTAVKALSNLLGFTPIVCSEALDAKAEANPDDPKWQQVIQDKKKGVLASDECAYEAVNYVLDMTRTYKPAFDGFPRKFIQVGQLGEIVMKLQVPLLVIELECSLVDANKRRLKRIQDAVAATKKTRKDDYEDVWKGRQKEYEAIYPELSSALRELAPYVVIDTTGRGEEENHARILTEIFYFAMSLLKKQ